MIEGEDGSLVKLILTGENRNIRSKTSHSATSSTTKFIWISLG